MEYNYSKLFGLIREKNLTQIDLAKLADISYASLNLKLNNKAIFRQSEISRICDVLNIQPDDIPKYFFAH